MSDCSTQALIPKEPPKCGTCYWMMMQPGHGECGACGNPLCAQDHDPVAYANGFYEYTTVDGDCRGKYWEPRTNTIEQRYQQLEQVAKNALATISTACMLTSEYNETIDVNLVNKNYTAAFCDLREQLEALGVSLDD